MGSHGPTAHPWRTLSNAAMDYAQSLEAEDLGPLSPVEKRRIKDRLRHAALDYQSAPKSKGRPRNA